MNPFLIFLLAILSPPLLALVLLVPLYMGILSAAYIIYYKSSAAAHPLADKLLDVFYIIDVYAKLFTQWIHHMTEMSAIFYTLPLLLLPILGTTAALWLTGKLATKLKDIFQLGVSH